MSEAQRELERRLKVIMARLHRDPAVRADLAAKVTDIPKPLPVTPAASTTRPSRRPTSIVRP
jgi:hypothetical protein